MRGHAHFLATFACLWAAGTASADVMRRAIPPPNCDALLNSIFLHSNAPPGRSVELGWRDTVELEHCDRMKRLERIASIQGLGAKPEFYDATITADRLPPAVGVRIPLLRVVFPERVFFDTNKSTLRPEAMEVVRIVAESLRREPPDVALFIAGHADERGANDYNLNLSIDRADALADAILADGVDVASVWRVGFGEDLPLIAGSNEYAWGQNRRIEFLFAARPEAIAVWAGEDQVDLLCQSTSRSASQNCKAKLTPVNQGYLIQEQVRQHSRVAPDSSQTTADITGGRESVEVLQTGASVGAAAAEKVTVAPAAPRKIVVNPVNRSVSRTELENL